VRPTRVVSHCRLIVARQAQKNNDLQLAGYVAPKLKAIELIESKEAPKPLNIIFTRATRSPITASNEGE
jgi:hypothetical protein